MENGTSNKKCGMTHRVADLANSLVNKHGWLDELLPEDFAILKETVNQQKADLEAQLNALDAETRTMETLLEETQRNLVNFAKAWSTGDAQQRRELCFALFPEGLRYSSESRFFEPHNTWLMSKIEEMWTRIEAEEELGVPGGI
jgi:hypothetical protein